MHRQCIRTVHVYDDDDDDAVARLLPSYAYCTRTTSNIPHCNVHSLPDYQIATIIEHFFLPLLTNITKIVSWVGLAFADYNKINCIFSQFYIKWIIHWVLCGFDSSFVSHHVSSLFRFFSFIESRAHSSLNFTDYYFSRKDASHGVLKHNISLKINWSNIQSKTNFLSENLNQTT